MCIAFTLYYPAKQSSQGESWICPHQPVMDLGTGCAGELEYTDLNGVDDLGRIFGESSGECASEQSSTNEYPNEEPATITISPNGLESGADWSRVPFLLPFASVLLMVILV
mmetsp:Transcript_27187/g.58251  ORF Transcript_27187/g.58251 Transcript_27187/m.58251 type:complete len:111 (-) Transcript_27187:176-508(-)